jgi:hypothetical protein
MTSKTIEALIAEIDYYNEWYKHTNEASGIVFTALRMTYAYDAIKAMYEENKRLREALGEGADARWHEPRAAKIERATTILKAHSEWLLDGDGYPRPDLAVGNAINTMLRFSDELHEEIRQLREANKAALEWFEVAMRGDIMAAPNAGLIVRKLSEAKIDIPTDMV